MEIMVVKTPVYMDYHATTPVDPRVLDTMLPYFNQEFGNAASIDHIYGSRAAEAVEKARKQIAHTINAKSEEIIFTSGATESDNLALLGVAEQNSDKGDHIITCATEHKAVLDSCKRLEKLGKSVTYLPVDMFGMVDIAAVENAITDRTILISIMAANNEVGTIAPIAEIGRIAHKHGVLFHTDAAQAAGHIPIDVEAMNIDLMSISAHKIYGPKGIGVLYVRRRNPKVNVAPIIFGGGHERGLRSGTLNVPGIVGFGKALEIAEKEMKAEDSRFRKWTANMLGSFQQAFGGSELYGHPIKRLAHNLNVSFEGIESKALLHLLRSDLAISAGSACTTAIVAPSHVLTAMGIDEKKAHSAVRFGLGRFNTEEEIEYAIERVIWAVSKLKRIS
jgi:cysteine desulfurase